MKGWGWVKRHLDYRFILTPLGVSNIYYGNSDEGVGYSDYYIFGIRLARIQKTKPWD